ncbi:DUF1080 domain-containing protein [Alienimonas sp. DA493]|uniref:3-keto-disaccharide hydrolase n=1 Tax=Alienimonas sp. DA493 TaxID=3373605 RepID=UPI003753F4A1
MRNVTFTPESGEPVPLRFGPPPVGGDDGFVELFDGKTLAGWEKRSGSATFEVEQVDGAPAIVGRSAAGSPSTYLCTEKTYGDFVLEFECKLSTRDFNSGVQIRSNVKFDGGREIVYGPQVDVMSSPGSAGYLYDQGTGRGWLVPRERHVKQNAFNNRGWNLFRVEARGDEIKTYLNGEPIADLTDRRGAKSGFVALQVHSYQGQGAGVVMWRNVRIKPLDDAAAGGGGAP